MGKESGKVLDNLIRGGVQRLMGRTREEAAQRIKDLEEENLEMRKFISSALYLANGELIINEQQLMNIKITRHNGLIAAERVK